MSATLLNHNDNAPTLPADVDSSGSFFVDLFVFGPGQPVITPTLPLESNANNPPSAACAQVDKKRMGADASVTISQWYDPQDPTCKSQARDLAPLFAVAGVYNVIAAVDTSCPGETYGCVNEGTLGGESNNLRRIAFVVSAPIRSGPLYLPVVARAPPAPLNCGDIEDNDTLTQARSLLVIGTACTGSLQDDPVEEDDYYWVDLAAGKRISIDLTQIPNGADYDLYLYDVQGRQVAFSNTGSPDEHIQNYANTSGATARYYLRIYMYQKSAVANNSYMLKVVVN